MTNRDESCYPSDGLDESLIEEVVRLREEGDILLQEQYGVAYDPTCKCQYLSVACEVVVLVEHHNVGNSHAVGVNDVAAAPEAQVHIIIVTLLSGIREEMESYRVDYTSVPESIQEPSHKEEH